MPHRPHPITLFNHWPPVQPTPSPPWPTRRPWCSFRQVRSEYMGVMSRILASHFKLYIASMERMQMTVSSKACVEEAAEGIEGVGRRRGRGIGAASMCVLVRVCSCVRNGERPCSQTCACNHTFHCCWNRRPAQHFVRQWTLSTPCGRHVCTLSSRPTATHFTVPISWLVYFSTFVHLSNSIQKSAFYSAVDP
eukprot:91073-Chlamydomonas_euryale.AAC.1